MVTFAALTSLYARTARLVINPPSTVERIWHTQDSQGQIPALAFRFQNTTPFKLLHLRSAPPCTDGASDTPPFWGIQPRVG